MPEQPEYPDQWAWSPAKVYCTRPLSCVYGYCTLHATITCTINCENIQQCFALHHLCSWGLLIYHHLSLNGNCICSGEVYAVITAQGVSKIYYRETCWKVSHSTGIRFSLFDCCIPRPPPPTPNAPQLITACENRLGFRNITGTMNYYWMNINMHLLMINLINK